MGGLTERGAQRRCVNARLPSNMALIGTKLCQNAFQTIPVKSILDAEKCRCFDTIFWSPYLCFAFLGQFWRLDKQTDLNIEFLAIFRFRCTYHELCTTKNRGK